MGDCGRWARNFVPGEGARGAKEGEEDDGLVGKHSNHVRYVYIYYDSVWFEGQRGEVGGKLEGSRLPTQGSDLRIQEEGTGVYDIFPPKGLWIIHLMELGTCLLVEHGYGGKKTARAAVVKSEATTTTTTTTR